MLCVHIPENGCEVSLLDLSGVPRTIAGPVPIDPALFQPGAELSPESIRAGLFETGGGSFQTTGRNLFDVVMTGGVLAEWAAARSHWDNDLSPSRPIFRTCLCVQNKRLAAIPWELMYSPSVSLFQSQKAPGLRCIDPAPGRRPDAPQLRIRVVVVNGADPNDQSIKADEEQAAIENILAANEHAFDLESIRTAGRGAGYGISQLEKEIETFAPHVLHFIGHSETPPAGGSGSLLLHNGNSYLRWYSPQIAAFLDRLNGLRLTYLNACRTGQASPLDRVKPVPALAHSLAEAFLRRSLGVVAMQHDVRGMAASLCARVFYECLAVGANVDEAICAARLELSNQFSPESAEAYLPALIVKVLPEDVLSLRRGQIEQVDEDVKRISQRFVNHRPARREVHEYLFGRPASQRRAILVTGSNGVGKTWLIKWTLYSLALRGIRVHYIAKPADNWLEILRQIRRPDDCMLSQGCCDHEQNNRFNWTLKHLSTGMIAPPYAPGAAIPDDRRSLSEILQGDPKPTNDFPEKLCAEMLSIFDQGQETVLAIDHWSLGARETEDTPQILHKHLFQPVARRRSTPLRLILSVSSNVKPEDFPGWGIEPVGNFDQRELPELAVQLLKKMYGTKVKDVDAAFVRSKALQSMSAQELYQNLESLRFLFP